MSRYRVTIRGIAICPYFIWQSEDIRNQSENDVSLVFCNHAKNPDNYEGNCQEKWCPLTEKKKEKENDNRPIEQRT